MLTRRQLLAAAAAAAGVGLLPRRARAIGDDSKFRFALLKTPGANWDPRPTALPRLAWELDKRTSIDVDLNTVALELTDDKLWDNPFLYVCGDGRFGPFEERELELLRRYLAFGGFVCIDSAEGQVGGGFDASVRQLVNDLFPHPQTGLVTVPEDHVLYKSFYLIDQPVGRIAVSPTMEAVIHDGRAVIVYNQNDLAGAWARDDYGNWEHECYPGGEDQRELAFRLGINIVMYALCLDYKSDQVHVPFILRRRKWRTSP